MTDSIDPGLVLNQLLGVVTPPSTGNRLAQPLPEHHEGDGILFADLLGAADLAANLPSLPHPSVDSAHLVVPPTPGHTGTTLPVSGEPPPETGSPLPQLPASMPPAAILPVATEAGANGESGPAATLPTTVREVAASLSPSPEARVSNQPAVPEALPVPGTQQPAPVPPTLPAQTPAPDRPTTSSTPAAATNAAVEMPQPIEGDTATGGAGADAQRHPREQPRSQPAITFHRVDVPSAPLTAPAPTPASVAPAPSSSSELTLLGERFSWPEPLANRMAGIVASGANSADLKLHPPSLGQIDIRITMQGDQASLWLSAANPEVREALQLALPRLDSLLSGQGIQLADYQLAEHDFDEFMQQAGSNTGGDDPGASNEEQPPAAQSAPRQAHAGLVDTWV